MINKRNKFWLEQIHNTKLILKFMKCSPQSGLWTHLTTLTLPVCPFSKVKTRFSWNRTQHLKHWYGFKHRVPDVHQQVHRATADSTFDKKTKKFSYQRVIQGHWMTCPKRDATSTTPRHNIWSPVGAASDMACFDYGRRHLGILSCDVAENMVVAKPVGLNNVPHPR